jgi:hypothetical protein
MAWKIPYPLVEIIWSDATSNSDSWVHLDDIATPEQINTTGFLVKEADDYVTVAASVSTQEETIGTVGNTMTIPKGMIVSRREVRIAKARKPKKI